MFEEFTRFLGKRIVPQPSQLFGLNAQARYAQWRSEREQEDYRDERKERKVVRGSFTLDERNLKALMRSLRLPETDVLVEKPEEFSIPFLKSKGIYQLVRRRRSEAMS